MKKRFVFAYLLTALAATGLHFAYVWLPLPLVGLFAPVRESVWEHLKLLFTPFFLSAFFLGRWEEDKTKFWSGMLAALLAMPVVLLGSYYTLSAGFGLRALWLDLLLFYLTLALGYALGYRLVRSGRAIGSAGGLVIAAGLYGAALVLFTYAPPELPIFLAG